MRGLNGEAHSFGKSFEFHLESFTCLSSPVESLLKNVFLNARGNKSMDGLAAMGPLAGFRGGDFASHSFQEIDGSFAKMRDELRGRDGFAVTLGVGARHEVRRNDKLQRFRSNPRAIGDDEIAQAEKGLIFLPHGNVEEGVSADNKEDAIAGVGVAEVADGFDGIVKLVAGEIVAGFGQRGNEMGMVGASKRDHGEAVGEGREMLLEFVRRTAGRDEVNLVEVEAAIGRPRDGEVSVVDGIEGATKKRDVAGMMFSGSAVRLGGGQ